MQLTKVVYQDEALECHGFLAYDPENGQSQSTVLVVHAFDGVTDFIRDYAEKIVAAGYAAFAVDMFGEGKTGSDFDGCIDLIMPFINDRVLLQERVLAGFKACQEQDVVDANRIAAMGFCFGGMSVLDLARAGADVKGVVSLHGVLAAPDDSVAHGDFSAKALVLHGYDDPQVGPDQLAPFAVEMNEKNVDWQFVFFGHTQHAYTEPKASDIGGLESGRVYNADSARRAWQYCQDFFAEVLSL